LSILEKIDIDQNLNFCQVKIQEKQFLKPDPIGDGKGGNSDNIVKTRKIPHVGWRKYQMGRRGGGEGGLPASLVRNYFKKMN
jgi:hypothetical protein